ncbi:MAG TPA: bifunctional serine/threonine-protein kinase/formylglycine-generating enzyme family protein [Chthoniobacterales bacterium]
MAATFEHYQLLENPDGTFFELGRGAMGITYKAFDTNLRCVVALKVINARLLGDEIAAERFLREARGAAQLRHRNVATVFHLGKHGDVCYYAMELIDGETVDALVKRDGPLPLLLALEIAQQVASALIAAEKKHLVHRDIKPSNLMLVRESDDEILVKVIDFGLVKSAMAQVAGGALTTSGFVGTPYYASPEQLDGRAEDVRSDIYSLGVTLWFMLTGQPPFVGSVASVIAQHLDRPPAFDSLAAIPPDVIAVLRQMLQKDLGERIQSPAQLRVELRACIENLKAAESTAVPSSDDEMNFERDIFGIHRGASWDPQTLDTGLVDSEDGSPLQNPMRDFVGSAAGERAGRKIRPAMVAASAIATVAAGAAAFWLLQGSEPTTDESPSSPSFSSVKPLTRPVSATPLKAGEQWTNSVGMRFVPVGRIHFADSETRVRDFQAFVDATGYDAEGGMFSLGEDGFKQHGGSWKNPGFPQTPNHPVVGVSWEDANQFCEWLTRKERNEGTLPSQKTYRLPTDLEWSQAVGLINESGNTPEARSEKIAGVYPWGTHHPPPVNDDNYAGAEARSGAPPEWSVIINREDRFARTAPVSDLPPNEAGIRGLGGNVWEWCADLYNNTAKWRVLRGGSWATSRPEEMLSSHRRGYDPSFRHDDIGFRCVIATDNKGVPP